MSDGSRRRFPVVLMALFVGSGCSALVYEIVWFHLLQLVIGSSAVSLGVLLGTFMGGMCLGSLALPHVISPRHHPLRVYAALEFATGVVAVIVVFAVPLAGGLYTASIGHGLPGLVLRALVCALCLLPPTILMGATLPAIARWTSPSGRGVSWLGLLYGGNIAGAVLGSIVAGFYLLRVHDMATATFAAAAINAIVAAIALRASFALRYDSVEVAPGPAHVEEASDVDKVWRVYAAVALSGMSALGAEVVWTRVLALMFGATVYTFSIILAVFLTGLGLGSAAAALLLRRKIDARAALGGCQLLLAATIAWTASLVAHTLPYWSNGAIPTDPSSLFLFDLMRSMAALLPATCLWGASFPLALASARTRQDDAGRLVGRVYAANTLGAIIGALGFSILLIPLVGTARAEQTLVALSALSAGLVLMPRPRLPQGALVVLITALTVGLVWSVPQLPPLLVAYGRSMAASGPAAILYVGEGVSAPIAVSQLESGVKNFHVGGQIEASTEPQDMRLQRMLGNLPALLHDKPASVLVIGFGAGVTAGSFIPNPDVGRVVICEIEPLIPARVAPFFARENYSVLQDPRVHLVLDDARHYVLTSHETFDIITSDPIHPWVKGAASLYTKEYFELVRQHLNPGGMVTQWVPLSESNPDVVKSEIATFFDVFPNGTIWGNPANGQNYDVVLLGTADRTPVRPIDVDALQARMQRREYARVTASLREVGFPSAIDLLASYAGNGPDLGPWLKDAEVNRDRNLRLQYLAGLGLRSFAGAFIYDEILAYRRLPSDRFAASDATMRQLWDAVARLRAGP